MLIWYLYENKLGPYCARYLYCGNVFKFYLQEFIWCYDQNILGELSQAYDY